jgi:exopolyphosphatase/guanosine-5'-triphosphate,3'-diphosphate pyrophosphatase
VESHSRNHRPAASRAARSVSSNRSKRATRPASARSIAVIDIGSNSVRLVVYQRLTRDLAPLFNEKTLCALGREVQSTGLLAPDAVAKALTALKRYRALCRTMKVGRVLAIATAACRDADNGAAFIAQAERACGAAIAVLPGSREARLSALGVSSGFFHPDGIVGDLGGGSLELIDIHDHDLRFGQTLPLGGLTLLDRSKKSPKRAARIVREELAKAAHLPGGAGRSFYAVGGTWRALARLHITQSGYPLHVMHGYAISAKEALTFARKVRRFAAANVLADVEDIAGPRRPLLAYAALVLEHIIRIARPTTIVFSTYGVREGLLFELMPEAERRRDGLIAAARTLNDLRARAPRHADDLIEWTDRLVKALALKETTDERRLRHAACLLSDIGWRAHPDYRGQQTMAVVSNGNFGTVSHQGRAFLALAVFYRYAGIKAENEAPELVRALVPPKMVERARLLGAMMRVAVLISAAQPGVLAATRFRNEGRKITLIFEPRIAALAAERVTSRFKQLARLVGRSGAVVTR